MNKGLRIAALALVPVLALALFCLGAGAVPALGSEIQDEAAPVAVQTDNVVAEGTEVVPVLKAWSYTKRTFVNGVAQPLKPQVALGVRSPFGVPRPS